MCFKFTAHALGLPWNAVHSELKVTSRTVLTDRSFSVIQGLLASYTMPHQKLFVSFKWRVGVHFSNRPWHILWSQNWVQFLAFICVIFENGLLWSELCSTLATMLWLRQLLRCYWLLSDSIFLRNFLSNCLVNFSFKFHSPEFEDSSNFEWIFNCHSYCKSLIAVAFIPLPKIIITRQKVVKLNRCNWTPPV